MPATGVAANWVGRSYAIPVGRDIANGAMGEQVLRRSRMWRALWISHLVQVAGFVAGMGAWVLLVLWGNGTLRVTHRVGWRALASLDKFDWFFAAAIGGVCAVVMLWVWAELMRRTSYLTEDGLKEMTTIIDGTGDNPGSELGLLHLGREAYIHSMTESNLRGVRPHLF